MGDVGFGNAIATNDATIAQQTLKSRGQNHGINIS